MVKTAPARRKLTLITIGMGLVGLFWIILRFYDFSSRITWTVEQAMIFWQLRDIVIDHKFSLIGTHFFRLDTGPIYRTGLANWLLSLPLLIFGFRVEVIYFLYLLISLGSLGLVVATAKRLVGNRGMILAGLFYGTSWFIRQRELAIWYAALLVPVGSVTVWWLFGRKQPDNSLRGIFFLGILLGFAVTSLHYVASWFMLGIIIYLLTGENRKAIHRTLALVSGASLPTLPLVVFNLKHNFLMLRGFELMILGKTFSQSLTFSQRISIVGQTMNELIGGIFGIPGTMWLLLLIGLLTVWVYFRNKTTNREKDFIRFVVIQVVLGAFGIYYASQGSYGSIHYISYLIPLIVVLLALVINGLISSPFKILVGLGLVLFLYVNWRQVSTYYDGKSYSVKRKLASYIYSLPVSRPVTIKFLTEDVLAYDFVFFETAYRLGQSYSHVDLTEHWVTKRVDYYVYDRGEPGQGTYVKSFGAIELAKGNGNN